MEIWFEVRESRHLSCEPRCLILNVLLLLATKECFPSGALSEEGGGMWQDANISAIHNVQF